ncbi:MAG TPA: glycoside hydrolase family 3 N-terminal domain-containing protein [Solirubrobacterales bacterium]|nr:glycoside hydrolase family 3 N-terminal domain-containing protein [Solirubrobacterales bacterium]
MRRKARKRPGRVATRRAVVVALAAGAFAAGAAMGSGEPQPSSSAASRLSAAHLAGQRIVIGFDGPRPPKPVRRMIRGGRVAGVVLFADNLPGRAATRRLTAELQGIPRPPGLRAPLLVMTDQEGGLVKRLDGPPGASAQAMGARGAAFSRAQGAATGRNLLGVGINVDLAPVLDVARPGGAIARTARGFGSSPGRVASTAVPFASGLQATGVAATAKHFPGFGAGRLNTDSAVERIELPASTLREVDEAPYRRFIAAGGELVMLSTAIYPALSASPAAFSREIATGELRDRLGFEGVAITDALETVAVRDFGGPAKAGLAATRAGVDLLLFTDHRAAARAWGALSGGLRSGALGRADFELSADRVLQLRHRLGRR